MTRAEMRRAQREKTKSETVYRLTPLQLNTIKKQAADEAVAKIRSQIQQKKIELDKESKQRHDQELADLGVEAFTWVLGISLKVLHDKYGFGTKRLGDFAELACGEFNDGDMTLPEIKKYIKDKVDIEIGVM